MGKREKYMGNLVILIASLETSIKFRSVQPLKGRVFFQAYAPAYLSLEAPMKKIALTQGKFAIVDDKDFERASQFRWYARLHFNVWYAMNKKMGHLHRFILELKKGDGKIVDHINRDGLDNKRLNLRLCTSGQNRSNAALQKNNTSGFKGVHWNKKISRWRVRCQKNGKRIELGHFKNIKDAAKIYDQNALDSYGEFALTNQAMGLL